MGTYVVTCQTSEAGRIDGLGGLDWWAPSKNIIDAIESGMHYFWLPLQGMEVEVIVKQSGTGEKYLTTKDVTISSEPKTLRLLPHCVESYFPPRED